MEIIVDKITLLDYTINVRVNRELALNTEVNMNNERQIASEMISKIKSGHGVAWKVDENTHAAVIKLPNNDTCIVWAGTGIYEDKICVQNKFPFLCAEYLGEAIGNTVDCTVANAGTDNVEIKVNNKVIVSKNTLNNPVINTKWETPTFNDFKNKRI